jgi:hypothetical protein
MKSYRWSTMAFVTLLLVLCPSVAWSAAFTEVGLFDWTGSTSGSTVASVAFSEIDSYPVIRALDPDEARRFPTQPKEVVRFEQFAILPDPVNGRELVDRILAVQAGEPGMTSTDQLQAPRRVDRRERIGSGWRAQLSRGV